MSYYTSSDVYHAHCLEVKGETYSIEFETVKGDFPIYISFVDPGVSRNIPRDKVVTPIDTLVSELVITLEDSGAWIRYKVNGALMNQTGSSLLKDGEDRIVRPMHPRCIKNILIYAVENVDDPVLTTAKVRLNCMI